MEQRKRKKKHIPPIVEIRGNASREVDFFLRIHRHLPDDKCGTSALGRCNYRPDGNPINLANERVSELQKSAAFMWKENEVTRAVKRHWDNK